MFAQYIQIHKYNWNVLVYYNVSYEDFAEIEDSLKQIECPKDYMNKAFRIIDGNKNTGFTFSNSDYKMSIVCIADTTSASQFVSTSVHEAKHVQSHICQYYDIDESGEEAAYLIGYLVHRMYKMVAKVIKHYVRFIGR